MKRKRFVTLFPSSQNVHLLKDVGMIPYILYREYGYDAALVSFRDVAGYPSLENEVEGLKLSFLEADPNYQFSKPSAKAIKYIWQNGSQIDILNLYHNTTETLFYGLVYKLRNPNGILYLKLDLNIERFEKCLTKLKWLGYNTFFRLVSSIISYELDTTGVYLKSIFPILKCKSLKVTNGVDEGLIRKEGIDVLPFDEKDNLIITVGRIGSPEKNHELLLEALKEVRLKDWTVVFIGPVEPLFQKKVEALFRDCPDLRERIRFTGPIYERKELYDWYNRAKVFCLTSRWESFGIVLVEALYFGNYIVTTNVASASELTRNGTIGSIFERESELTGILQDVIDNKIVLEDYYVYIREFSRNYIWKDILCPLDERLKVLMK